MEKYTFEEIINKKWSIETVSRSENPCVDIREDDIETNNEQVVVGFDFNEEHTSEVAYNTIGTMFEFPIYWADYKPIIHNMSKIEADKIFRMLIYSAEMFKMVKSLETEAAKALIAKIQEGSIELPYNDEE